MSNKFRRTPAGLGRQGQSGFTLLELSVVLAIIGLIIGAIAIGKDVQRDAEYTKIKNKFIDQWEQAYNQHYQRTGVVVGDSQMAPLLMVNGAAVPASAAASGAVLSGGDMTTFAAPGRVCNGIQGPNMATRNAAAALNLREQMAQAGVRMPPGRSEGREDRYAYLDSNGNPQELQVCFQWNNPSRPDGSGNAMIISGLTPDLARMLDQMIDGKADAREGRFRQQGVSNATANQPGTQWNLTNINPMNAASGATGADEDQVATVVAIYKMTQ